MSVSAGPWTHKLGYVVPSWNTVVEYETVRMLPAGVSAHFGRVAHTEDSPASMRHMADAFPAQRALLTHAKVDVVCFACTGASLYRGCEADRAEAARVGAAGPPVVTAAAALVEAARHLGLARVAVAAPYEDWLMAHLVRYLRDAGLTVVNAVGLGHAADILYPAEAALELALRAWSEPADGLVLSCGNFRSLEAVPEVEQRIGKPLLTSNTAALWSALSTAGWHGSVAGAGVLLERIEPLSQPPQAGVA
jgi:maleate isomerase